VTRRILSLTATLLAAPALFASAAQACISCEYVPEVARSPAPTYQARSYVRERVYAVERERHSRPAKKHIVQPEPVAKTIDTADQAPIKTQAKSENSSIATTPPAEPAKIDLKAAQIENSSIYLASKQTAAADTTPLAATTQQASVKAVDCKKFFPSVGMTVSVPCE
jgi:hypothetical protein